MSVSIRPYRLADAAAACEAALESVREVRPFMPWCRPGMTVDDQRAWIQAQVVAFEGRTAYEFAIVSEDGGYLGGCGLNQIDAANRRANLGYWVRSSATDRGVATAAVRQLVQWAFAHTDLVRLEVVVSMQNAASLRVAEKAGAMREGIARRRLLLHGTWHDAVFFAFVRDEHKSSPPTSLSHRRLPALVAHADWSYNPGKRWIAIARRHADGYEVSQPEPVGEIGSLFTRLGARAGGDQVVLGVDFPIGLPVAYAKVAGIKRFLEALSTFGTGPWSQFYGIASRPAEIGVRRPFYPQGMTGGSSREHLVSALRLSLWDDLLRQCERRQEGRNAASPLFWTLGGQQVGRAAIIGWRDLLAPALASEPEAVGVWPFHGSLDRLLAERRWIVAETYPAEACIHLGLLPPGKRWSKRNPADRRRQAEHLVRWAERRPVVPTEVLEAAMRDGFGPGVGREDGFDAVLGVLSMLEVLLGYRTDGAPTTATVREVEGWIFGQLSGGQRDELEQAQSAPISTPE